MKVKITSMKVKINREIEVEIVPNVDKKKSIK